MSNFTLGVTTVTFATRSPEEIIDLAVKAGLAGIEWNTKAHALTDNLPRAKEIGEKTKAAGLINTSCGAYYALCQGNDFQPVLDTALALNAPLIRIWAGSVGSAEASAEYRREAATELRSVCHTAKEKGLSIGLEYHRHTLTDEVNSAVSLMDDADCDNLYAYWQPNPDISHQEHMREITLLKDRLCALHVFAWTGKNVRHPLADQREQWIEYLSLIKELKCALLFEFVKDDSPEQFLRDADALREIIGAIH